MNFLGLLWEVATIETIGLTGLTDLTGPTNLTQPTTQRMAINITTTITANTIAAIVQMITY